MKSCSFLIIFGILMVLCTSGFAQFRPCTFQTDISGVAIWMDGATPVISPGMSFAINFYVTQTGITSTNRGDWSSPFKVTGTGLAGVTWAGTPDTSTFNTWVPTAFWNMWDAFRTTYAESWDGSLPDQLNITGIGTIGLGNVTHLKCLNIKASAVTLLDPNIPGTICVEQGDMLNNDYDWIFDDTVPTFTKTCFPVKRCGNWPPFFRDCPAALTTQHDIPFSYDFNAVDLEYDPIVYSILSGPGTIDPQSGQWIWDPPCDSVGKSISLMIRARDPLPCPPAGICTVNLVVQNSTPVIGGDCGKIFTMCDGLFQTHFSASDADTGDTMTWSAAVVPTPAGTYGISNGGILTFDPAEPNFNGDFVFTITVTDCPGAYDQCEVTYHILDGGCLGGDPNGNQIVNALDVTYLINFLYKSGPAPKPDPLCSGDADGNCLTNILDITYLINYLYKHGQSIGCNVCL